MIMSKKNSAKKNLLCLLTIFAFFYFECVYAEEIIFIVNKSVSINKISEDDLMKIYTCKKQKWDDGQEIKLVVTSKAKYHETFTKRYSRKTPEQFLRYWRTMLFAGKAMNPKDCATAVEMIEYVSNQNGAIGYLSSDVELNANVNILSVE
jgi:ABC-type phosphate transport system substrate-binding protein